ncbi:MAG: AAA family ATPase [Paludibacteraceae bacterium]|nr:AAA family ATPase [Paludibacteraceae bacterium]
MGNSTESKRYLQYKLPDDSQSIKMSEMLNEKEPVIGRKDDSLDNYIQSGIKEADIILVRTDDKAIALCKIINKVIDDKYQKELEEKYKLKYFKYVKILERANGNRQLDKGLFKTDKQGGIFSCESYPEQYKYIDDWMTLIKKEYKESKNKRYNNIVNTWKKCKNIVLYGAPGTGKTYNVPELAVRLCDPEFNADKKGREELMNRYNQLKQGKRIAFTTFHQSMDYEDWIEGLCPIVNDNNQVTYDIKTGIFKQLCNDAERPIITDKHIGIADDAVIWKVSLNGTKNTKDKSVRTDCMKNNYIRIGWDDYGAVISDETDWNIYNGEGKQILDAFINRMKEGDIVMSCYSNKTIDAIGVITGDYEYIDKLPHYKRVRKVNWLIKGINENIVDMNDGKTMTPSTVYKLNSITLDNVKSILDKYKKPTLMEDNTKPYVMVIDEMNRGNVSKIFGELITLLERDKRKGHKDAESVLLPYSKKPFQIPDNVYIIGTMNTADRSLGTLDYAIRRRFAFIADRPISLDLEVDGFNAVIFKKVSQLFIANYDDYEESGWSQCLKLIPAETLSEEYKPEDVWIGHSYFIMTDENGVDCTSDRLRYEIIPLLEEYVRDGVLKPEAQETIDELYNIASKE